MTVIVGTGFLAMLGLVASGTRVNAEATEMTTAVNLANSVREMTLRLAFADAANHWGLDNGETIQNCDNVEDLDGAVFSPPVDASRAAIANLATWRQRVRVQSIDPGAVDLEVPNDTSASPMLRVTCTVENNGVQVHQLEWLIVDPE